MRVLFLTLILLVPLSSNSFAITNESLYKWCKPFADSAFKFEQDSDFSCTAYVYGALEYANNVCLIAKELAKRDTSHFITTSFFGASEDANRNSVIQAYVNKMKNEPEQWGYTPNEALRQVFTEIAPCK